VVASQTPDPAAGGEIAVRLFSGERPARIEIVGVDGEARVLDAHEPGTEFESTSGVTIRLPDGGTRQIDYPITVSVLGDSLRILVRLPVEDYVAAVLAGEAGGFRSGESLKAMAVAIRTYAAHFSDRHEGEGFDLCDTTHCQDFRVTAIESRFEEAARDTSGEVLLYGGQPIPAYYHQDCGGVTEPQSPYLRLLDDAFCVARGESAWTRELSGADLEAALDIGGVTSIDVIERTASGRAGRLRLEGAAARVMGAEAFRLAIGRALGWDRLPSDLYEVWRSETAFVFEGRGAGHGVGLCQTGTAVMGDQGYGYREILDYYYPGTTIDSTPGMFR
jgi:stage II sporulation protein D